MAKKLLIVGAGQYGRLVKEIALDTGAFEQIDFLDDKSSSAIGKVSESRSFIGKYDCAIVAIGNPTVRLKLLNELEGFFDISPLIHPRAYVSPSAEIGLGSVIEPLAVVHTEAKLGLGCIISAGAVVNHAAKCAEGVHIDCNATVAGYAEVPAETKVESGKVFRAIYE